MLKHITQGTGKKKKKGVSQILEYLDWKRYSHTIQYNILICLFINMLNHSFQ